MLDKAMAGGRCHLMASLGDDAFGRTFDHFDFGLQCILDAWNIIWRNGIRDSRHSVAGAGV
ncbi:hypothetical protein [Nocardia brasiliensis]|uniref:hypothetical protein n=1 Tax=Nocardia brasiliensis TaxID=37326 RepID=UPI00245549D6|nr:hypothetical protein [Nocardia brasiliensis]